MKAQSFDDYLKIYYPAQNSGARSSYMNAIRIIDELFEQRDVFNLNNKSLFEIRDPHLISRIADYVAQEEDLYRQGENSLFDLGKSTQTSYPKKRFCTAAIRRLEDFINYYCENEAINIMTTSVPNGSKLSSKLSKQFDVNDKGTEREIKTKQRIGQNIFRAILLDLYDSKCCLTGIDIPEVLRASHIISWAENVKTRLNPENGLCLSATYDAAFDKYLISFDENYRMILSPIIKEAYTSTAFQTYFRDFEGKQINLPQTYKPSQEYLAKHRTKLIS